jgi:ribA/ribD-fused uncharacterized protein
MVLSPKYYNMLGVSPEAQEYRLNECCSFKKAEGTWGPLSNLSTRYPFKLNGVQVHTTEALFQALRFPEYPVTQELILLPTSPVQAKTQAKKLLGSQSRKDFEEIKLQLMYWCLRVKFIKHYGSMGDMFDKSGDREIVELTANDAYWGCIEDKEDKNIARGQNMIGKLLMKLRSFYNDTKATGEFMFVEPLEIEEFKLKGQPIGRVEHPVWSKKYAVAAASDAMGNQ